MRIKKFFLVLLVCFMILGTISNAIVFDNSMLTYNNSKESYIVSSFEEEYQINDNDIIEEKEIISLAKKTTFLLLGEPNQNNESSENYYKRHKEYLELRYNPTVPRDNSTSSKLDTDSEEYRDDIISGFSVPGMFVKLEKLNIVYKNYGDIRATKIGDETVACIVKLLDVKMKSEDKVEIETNLNLYYLFKKLNDEYKLYYLYAETGDEIESYIENREEKNGNISYISEYRSNLQDIYDFSQIGYITDNLLNSIYEKNKRSIVYLESLSNYGSVASANGFFINNGLIVTTWSFIEKSLMRGETILIKDLTGEMYNLDGIVTANLSNDIAIIKIKEKNDSYIEVNSNIITQIEDPVFTINSYLGITTEACKGIMLSNETDYQISIPVTEKSRRKSII